MRAKPLGWTPGLDVALSQQLTTIDMGVANAVDASGGGDYNPTAPIQIGGAGMRCEAADALFGDITIADTCSLSSDARFAYNVNWSGPASDETITAYYDEYHVTPAADITWTMAMTSDDETGKVVRIVIRPHVADHVMHIEREITASPGHELMLDVTIHGSTSTDILTVDLVCIGHVWHILSLGAPGASDMTTRFDNFNFALAT